jgi:predicted nicotinamide N-methyase
MIGMKLQTRVPYSTKLWETELAGRPFSFHIIDDLDKAIDLICQELNQDDPLSEDLSPYFGVIWPSCLGLCQHIEQQRYLKADTKIVEIGCGLALPSFLCRSFGANVCAIDYHPDVWPFIQLNQEHNHISFDYLRANWRGDDLGQLGSFDLVLGSDILYESRHPLEVAKRLWSLCSPGGTILLSDPGRSYLQNFATAMTELGAATKTHIEVIGKDEIFVLEFKRPL